MPITSTHTHGEYRTGHFGGDHLDTPVRDVMTPGVVSIAEDASLIQVFRAMRAHDVHAVLVVGTQHGSPVGWVTARGLLAWVGQDVGLVHARDAVTERVHTIDAGASARDALMMLSQPETSHLLVVRGRDVLPEGVISPVNLITLERS
ncbi:MAG TPA: CBS domain-containing protein [Thermoleophilaceae bacterium]